MSDQRPSPIRAPPDAQDETEHTTQEQSEGQDQEQDQEQQPQTASFQIPTEWGMKALIALNYTSTAISYVGAFLWKVGRGVWKSFQPETFVFFKDSAFPYNKNDLHLDAPGVPPVAWYYDASNHILISGHLYDTSEKIRVHHLPYLSAEIKYNDLLLHDITEFIETLRWGGDPDQNSPSAAVLLATWSLQTGIVLQKSESLKLVVINEEGNEQEISLHAAARV